MCSANDKPRTRLNAGGPLIMLVTDSAVSVMATLTASQWQGIAYSPFGVRHPRASVANLLGFNGAKPEPATGHYLLGNGHRGFNPVLMRFNSPDRLSPFERGGLNTYAYCLGDPINRQDPLGNFSFFNPLPRLIPKSWRNRAIQRRPSLHNVLPERLDDELGVVRLYARRFGQDQRKVIHHREDLISAVQGGQGGSLKFIMSSTEEFAVARSVRGYLGGYVSHPAMMDLLKNKRVISAGGVLAENINQNELTLINLSGHYRPTVEHLDPAVRKLTELGFKVKTLRVS